MFVRDTVNYIGRSLNDFRNGFVYGASVTISFPLAAPSVIRYLNDHEQVEKDKPSLYFSSFPEFIGEATGVSLGLFAHGLMLKAAIEKGMIFGLLYFGAPNMLSALYECERQNEIVK